MSSHPRRSTRRRYRSTHSDKGSAGTDRHVGADGYVVVESFFEDVDLFFERFAYFGGGGLHCGDKGCDLFFVEVGDL